MKNSKDLVVTDNDITENPTSRRTFVKKALYSAPTLLVLGSLSKPTVLFALGDSTGTGFGGVGGGGAPAQTGGNSSGLNSGFGAN